uniref:Ig-like domain-containing protein n=1 Tax=Scophthalmus maximus TaxID=52904 RepID=A0A8D3AKU7_SCOMX
MWPKLEEFFPGDLFYLSCDNIASSSRVQWYLNNTVVKQSPTSETWKIAVASPKHSGFYHCENNGQRSDNLIVKEDTGHPVMKTGHSVMLQLDNEDGLQGWKCGVYRRALNQMKKIKFHLKITKECASPNSLMKIQHSLGVITFKVLKPLLMIILMHHLVSDKEVSLEMYPLPPVVGEPLTLRCLVWGTDQISNTVFYKDNAVIIGAVSSTHTITNVTELTEGQYKCDVTYTHKAQAAGPPYHEVSDTQEVFVQGTAIISEIYGLSCSCPLCGRDSSYHWYHRNDDQLWASMGFNSNYFTPKASGSYACRAVWTNGRSFLSNSYACELLLPFLDIFVTHMVNLSRCELRSL